MEQTASEDCESQDAKSVDTVADEPNELKDPIKSGVNDDAEYNSKTKESKTYAKKISSQKKSGLEERLKEDSDKEKPERKRSSHGSVAFIHYTYPETGVIEYLVEENKPDYQGQDGLYRLIGGARDFINGRLEGSLKAIKREFQEEFKSSEASSIVIRLLENDPRKIDSIIEIVDGKIAITDVYEIKVESKMEWDKIKSSGSKGDAGIFRAVRYNKLLELDDRYFAFNSGNLIKELVYNGTVEKVSDFSKYNNQKPLTFYLAQHYLAA